MRVVLDTNVFVSAVLGGKLTPLLDHWRLGHFVLIATDEIVREYHDVLRRPKFDLPSSVVEDIIGFVFRRAEFIVPTEKVIVIQEDPKDNCFLEAAIAGAVDTIVSGDRHLLNLKAFRNIPIIAASTFLDRSSKRHA